MLRGFMEDHQFQACNSEGLIFPLEATASLLNPWPTPSTAHDHHQLQANTNSSVANLDSFFSSLSHPPSPLPPTLYGEFTAPRVPTARQFAYAARSGAGLSSNSFGLAGLRTTPSPRYPFGCHQAEFTTMTAQEIIDAKALAASKSHSEAERRRRERINAHLARLRSLLPNTTKTDKATLLAEVIQHVKELRQQTSEIAEESSLPTETDELTVDTDSDEEGRTVVRASICCDDRSDLLPDVMRTLKALKLRALRAEITTLGGRIKNVLLITGDDDSQCYEHHQSIGIIQDALKTVMESAAAHETSSSSSVKRQRTNSLSSVLQHRSIWARTKNKYTSFTT